VWRDYGAHIVGVVTNVLGDAESSPFCSCCNTLIFCSFDCYTHQVFFTSSLHSYTNYITTRWILLSVTTSSLRPKLFEFTKPRWQSSLLGCRVRPSFSCSYKKFKELYLEAMASRLSSGAVLTQWTMHYQAYWRLWELCNVIITVIEDDEKVATKASQVVMGDAKVKEKARKMVKLIKNTRFWTHSLCTS